MEKDYFKDRPIESTLYREIHPSDEVYICEKHMQKSACELNDLTWGTVVRLLTRHDHPRGIKVEIVTEDDRRAIGRVVYLFRDNKMLTKNGPINF